MEESSNISSSFEILLLEEFADRLKVGRSTVCNWKNDGTLIAGRHYIQRGKVVRYIWARDLILELHDENHQEKERDLKQKLSQNNTYNQEVSSKKTGINLDY